MGADSSRPLAKVVIVGVSGVILSVIDEPVATLSNVGHKRISDEQWP